MLFKNFFSLTLILVLFSHFGYAQANSDLVTFQNSPAIWSPKGYSQAVVVDLGKVKMVTIAGQIPFDSSGILIGPGNFRKQAEQIFINIKKLVEQAGGNMNHLIKLNYFVTDVSQLTVLREVRNQFVNLDKPPASTLVQVAKLFRDDILLEIEATAIIPNQ